MKKLFALIQDFVSKLKNKMTKRLKIIILIATAIVSLTTLVFVGLSIAEGIQSNRADNILKSLNGRYFVSASEYEYEIYSFQGERAAIFYASKDEENFINFLSGDLTSYDQNVACSLDLLGNANIYIDSDTFNLYYDRNWNATSFGSAEEVSAEKAEELVQSAQKSLAVYEKKMEKELDQTCVVGTWDHYSEYDTLYKVYETKSSLYSTISFYSDGTGKLRYNSSKYDIASEFTWTFYENDDGVRTYKVKMKSGSSSTYYALVSESKDTLMWVLDGGRYVSVFK